MRKKALPPKGGPQPLPGHPGVLVELPEVGPENCTAAPSAPACAGVASLSTRGTTMHCGPICCGCAGSVCTLAR